MSIIIIKKIKKCEVKIKRITIFPEHVGILGKTICDPRYLLLSIKINKSINIYLLYVAYIQLLLLLNKYIHQIKLNKKIVLEDLHKQKYLLLKCLHNHN